MNKVVIYTPAEEMVYSSGFLSNVVVWTLCLFFGVLITLMAGYGKKLKTKLDYVKFCLLVVCVTYTLHCGLVWFLIKI